MSIKTITTTLLSAGTPIKGTFQSHTQLVVANAGGIFVCTETTEVGDSYPQAGLATIWAVHRSTDGGNTFAPIFWGPWSHCSPPTIETDEDGNIYVFCFDYAPAGAYQTANSLTIYKLSAAQNYTDGHAIGQLAGAGQGGKHTAIYDRYRQCFYTAGFLTDPIRTFDKNGNFLRSLSAFANGPSSSLEYPHLTIDGSNVYIGWTTTPNSYPNSSIPYNGIRWTYSEDGMFSLRHPAGGHLSLPITPDDTGPIAELVPAQYAGQYSAWLSNMSVMNGIAHFMYQVQQPNNTHEVYHRFGIYPLRYLTLADGTWQADGDRINSLDGFFTHARAATSTIYAVGYDRSQQDANGRCPVVAFKSIDDGATWDIFARSEALFNAYALGGARYLDGHGINAVFTDYVDSSGAMNSQRQYFFHLEE